MRLAFNVLAILGSAAFAGVMLTLGSYWKSLPASDFLNWFGQNHRFIMQVIPLVVVPALLGLAGSLWLDWNNVNTRVLWISALLCIVTVLVLTVAWFVPTNAQFAAKSIPLD